MSSLDPIALDMAVLARSAYPVIYLLTQEEARAVDLVAQSARASKKALHQWSISRGWRQLTPDLKAVELAPVHADRAQSPDQVAESALPYLVAQELPSFFLLLDFHRFLSSPPVLRQIRDYIPHLVKRRQSLIMVAPTEALPPELAQDTAVMNIPLPSREVLRRELDRVAASERVQIEAAVADRAVRSALGLALNEAGRVFRKVMVMRRGFTDQDLHLVVEEKKRRLEGSETLEFHELDEGLAHVGGHGELKRWLHDRSRAFGEEARSFGLPPPKGLLLLGVQGCGKSLSAKAVAELWTFPLLRLDLGAVFGGSRGGSPEAAIRQAIKVAESLAPVVLWVDEIEKGFAQSEGRESSSRVFGSFLTWLAEKRAEVFVVATANRVTALPPELLRRGRFDEVFFVDLPNVQERLEILRIHLRKRKRDPGAYPRLEQFAEKAEYFSGAELEQVVVAGLYRAFSQARELSEADLDIAIQQTVPLYATYEDDIKALRDWARTRARPATLDSSVLDLFGV